MAVEVGIVGLPGAGKTTLFNALTRAGAETHPRKEHVGMAPVPDGRLERVRTQAKSGDPALRREVAGLEALLAHLEAGGTISEYPAGAPPELEPLTTKPLLAVENGPGGSDLKLEAELAELDEEEAA